MNVSREVILDLLPLYVAGEASRDSAALVEEYLLRDPELAARAQALRNESGIPAGAPVPDLELATIRRARRVIGALRWLLALGTSLSALSLAMHATFRDGRLVDFNFVIRDYPWLWVPLVIGAGCLAAYFVLRGRLRYSSR